MKYYPTLPLLLVLAACSSAPQVRTIRTIQHCEPARQQIDTAHEIDSLMQYYDRLTALPAEKLFDEKKALSDEYSKTASDQSRIRLAMLLWLPEAPFRDKKAALDLLGKDFTDKGLESFARLFKAAIAEQQASDDAQHDLEQLLDKERKHSAALQNKIDAVKKMEKTFLNHKGKP